jgi:hypothetical protein
VQEGDDLHFQDDQYVEGQSLGGPEDGCKISKMCRGDRRNKTEISRSKGRE